VISIVITASVHHEYEFARNPDKHGLLQDNRLNFLLSDFSPRLLFLVWRRCFSTAHWHGGRHDDLNARPLDRVG
jgi:hypothetical protein